MLSRDPAPFLARMPHLACRAEFDWLTGHPASFVFPPRSHDYILHLATATSAHLDRTDPRLMLETKFASIRHVLDYARHADIRRMLVTSSGAVYGPQPPELAHIPETYNGAPDSMNPASAYGNGKRMVEQMCALTPTVDTVIARCFSFIGPHLPLDARFAAGNFLRDALVGRPIVIQGDGRSVRSYLHASDLTIWLLTLLLKGRACHAYNVGSDQAVSTYDLARCIAAQISAPTSVSILGKKMTEKPADHYVPDVTRAATELGLTPLLGLEAAISRTLKWLLLHG